MSPKRCALHVAARRQPSHPPARGRARLRRVRARRQAARRAHACGRASPRDRHADDRGRRESSSRRRRCGTGCRGRSRGGRNLHAGARHLAGRVRAFMARHPKVRLSIHPCSPSEAAERVHRGEATLCLSTEVVATFPDLAMLPGDPWHRCVITPPRHPLLRQRRLGLAAIARYPLVTYDFAFRKGSKIQRAFETAGLARRVVVTSTDPRIIKTYVSAGLGIGLIASIAFEQSDRRHLRARRESALRVEHDDDRRPSQHLRHELHV